MVSNASLIYAKPPHGAPVPGETIKRVVDDNFDPETVALNGGILVQAKVTRRSRLPRLYLPLV